MTTPAAPAETETEIPPELVPKKRRFWPVAGAFVAIAGVAGFFGLRSLREPEPLRVVVAVDLDGNFWEGSRASARLVNELCQRLDAIGFQPVRAADPEILAVLKEAESPEAAAKELRAAFVVKAKLTPEVIEHPVEGGYFEVRADASFEVHHVRDEVPQQGRVVSWTGGQGKDDALRRLADTLALQAFDQVVPHLVKHPEIQSIFQGNDIKLADHVAKAKKYVESRGDRLSEAERSYADLEKRRKEHDAGPTKVTYHSSIGADDALGGSAAPGVLVKTAGITPFVAPRTMKLSYFTGLETLEWRKPGGERKVLWSGYHLFSYPAAAPDGGRVVFAEDLFGWAKTLTVVDPDGKSRRLRVDAEHRFSSPKVAPGGAAAAIYDRPCRECPSKLVVVSLDDGKALYERLPEGGSFSGFAWIGPNRLAYLHTPVPPLGGPGEPMDMTPKDPVQSLYAVDLAASPPAVTTLKRVPVGNSYQGIEASRDGKKLVLTRGDLTIHDVEANTFTDYPLPFSFPDNPSFSPDAKLVAFTWYGDVFLFDVEKKETRRFTRNPWKERYPVFSEDGTRIYFESLSDDPNYDRRTMSLIGSVAVKDAGPPEQPASP